MKKAVGETDTFLMLSVLFLHVYYSRIMKCASAALSGSVPFQPSASITVRCACCNLRRKVGSHSPKLELSPVVERDRWRIFALAFGDALPIIDDNGAPAVFEISAPTRCGDAPPPAYLRARMISIESTRPGSGIEST